MQMRHRPTQRPARSEQERQDEANRSTRSLAALALVLLLVVLGLLLFEWLTDESRLEDCLLAGRSNCSLLLPDR